MQCEPITVSAPHTRQGHDNLSQRLRPVAVSLLGNGVSVAPNFLNHVVWYSATGWVRPYPGEAEVEMPSPFVKARQEVSR